MKAGPSQQPLLHFPLHLLPGAKPPPAQPHAAPTTRPSPSLSPERRGQRRPSPHSRVQGEAEGAWQEEGLEGEGERPPPPGTRTFTEIGAGKDTWARGREAQRGQWKALGPRGRQDPEQWGGGEGGQVGAQPRKGVTMGSTEVRKWAPPAPAVSLRVSHLCLWVSVPAEPHPRYGVPSAASPRLRTKPSVDPGGRGCSEPLGGLGFPATGYLSPQTSTGLWASLLPRGQRQTALWTIWGGHPAEVWSRPKPSFCKESPRPEGLDKARSGGGQEGGGLRRGVGRGEGRGRIGRGG